MFPVLIRTLAIAIVLISIVLTNSSYAINYGAAAKRSDGLNLAFYPYWVTADSFTDVAGNTVVDDFQMDKNGVAFSGTFYRGNYFLSALVPVSKLEVGFAHGDDSGLGDIQIRAGWYPPVSGITILPLLMVKFPTGSFDKDKSVNIGDGQTDIAAELYVFKQSGKLSFDAVTRYMVRMRNSESGVTPGNEFSLEGLVTWSFTKKLKIGPAINFVVGDDRKQHGVVIKNSGIKRVAIGGEIFYGGFSKAKLSLAAYKDVLTHNTYEGIFVLSRIVVPF